MAAAVPGALLVSVSTTPTPRCTFDSLPMDILALIFAHFKIRPLIKVVSLVCRRFNRTAPLAVRSIYRRWWSHIPEQIVTRLANLQQAAILDDEERVPCFSDECMRWLFARVPGFNAAGFPLELVQSTRINSLTITRSLAVDRSKHLPLITNSGSLTRLTLGSPAAGAFPRVPISSLQNIVIDLAYDSYFDIDVIILYITQLTSLTLPIWYVEDLDRLCTYTSLPRLRSLSLHLHALEEEEAFYSWLNALTSLTSFSLEVAVPQIDLSRLPTLILTSLSCTAKELSALITDTRCGKKPFFPRLLRLVVLSNGFPLGGLIAQQLQSLDVSWDVVMNAATRSGLTALTKLRVRHNQNQGEDMAVLLAWQLPCLRSLKVFTTTTLTASQSLARLQSIVKLWPTLWSLHANQLRECVDPASADELRRVIHEAAQGGLRKVVLGQPSQPWREELMASHTLQPWLLLWTCGCNKTECF